MLLFNNVERIIVKEENTMRKKLTALTLSFVLTLSMVAAGFVFCDISVEAKTYSSKTGNGIVATVTNPGETLNPFTDEDARYIWKGNYEDYFANYPEWYRWDFIGFDNYDNTGKQETIKKDSVINIDFESSGISKDRITKVEAWWSQYQRTNCNPSNWDGNYDENGTYLIVAADSDLNNRQYWDGTCGCDENGNATINGEEADIDREDVEGLTNWVKSDEFNGFHVFGNMYGNGNTTLTIYITYVNSENKTVTDAVNLVYEYEKEKTSVRDNYRFHFKDNDGAEGDEVNPAPESDASQTNAPGSSIDDLINNAGVPSSVEAVSGGVDIQSIKTITSPEVIKSYIEYAKATRLNTAVGVDGKPIHWHACWLFDLYASGSGKVSIYVGTEYVGKIAVVSHYKNGQWTTQQCKVQSDGKIYPYFASFSPIGVLMSDQTEYIASIPTTESMKVTAPKTGDNWLIYLLLHQINDIIINHAKKNIYNTYNSMDDSNICIFCEGR